MKKSCLILLILFSCTYCFGQKIQLSGKQVQSLALLGECWGFLKYYHPQVAKGKWDWDSVLFKKIPLYRDAKDNEVISQLTSDWIKELGPIPACKSCYQQVPDSLAYNLDFSWMSENNFSADVLAELKNIRQNRHIGFHYYVEYQKRNLVHFVHEKVYNEHKYFYPDAEARLLLLFRYWNFVNYFSPYKYLSDKKWSGVLRDEIPAFYGAKDTLAYHLEFVKLVNALDDGHSYASSVAIERSKGNFYHVPFTCMLIDNQFVVNFIFNESAAALLRIKKGDVIKEVNGEDVVSRYKRLSPYVMASNEDTRIMNFASRDLFRGNDSVFIVKKLRAGITIVDTIQFSQRPYSLDIPPKHWNILHDSIGYVNTDALQRNEVDSMMKELMHTKALIIDLRAYPHNTWNLIAGYLSQKPFAMSKISYPDLDYPGVFLDMKPEIFGRNNPSPYKGKVILLVDEGSASHAEYSAMGLQAATHTITIGNTTAGQNGDVCERFWLPGGLTSRFSGLGVRYLDGTPMQRRGVKIDIKVQPTIKGLQEGKDEVLEKAVKYVSQTSDTAHNSSFKK